MKKVLAFVLVLSMILGSFGMAFAAAPADVAGEKYEDAVNVLVELGVVAGYKDGTFRPENIVTRAEMATFLIKAMGLADYAVAKSSFSDMAGHWADPFVAYAASLGIVAGYADGTFKPDVTVSYDQAITMVIQALGYKGEYLVGGFPGAFVNQAKALGILDGIKSGAAGANRGDIATLLYNALNEQFVRYDKDGGLEYTADKMIVRLGAHLAEEEYLVLGGEEALIEIKEYQGALVNTYENSDAEIVAVEVLSTFLTGEYDAEDDVFVVGDKEYKLKDAAKEDVTLFVNGAVDGEAAITDYADEEVVIAAKISGKYLSEVYSIADWAVDGYFQMTEDMVEEFAEDETLNGFEFYFNDEDEIEGVVLVGVEALDKIAEDDIVTVYLGTVEDEDNVVVKVAVGTETVEGKISRVSKDDEYTINGKKYEAEMIEGAVALGDEGTFYLNASGKIAAFEGVSKVENFAIITKAMGTDKNTGAYEASSSVKIKLMAADGKEVVYTVEEDYAETIDVADYAAGVVTFSVDKNGEIDEITTKAAIAVDGAEMSKKGFLAGYAVADEVIVFEYDAVEDEYAVVALKDVPVAEPLADTAYVLNEDDEVVVIVLDAAATATEDGIYGIVVAYDEIEDADGEDIYEVVMLVDGEKETYVTADQALKATLEAAAGLQKIELVDGKLDVVAAAEDEMVASAAAIAVKANGINVGAGIVDVADDVVVYLYDAEEDEYTVSKLSSIKAEDLVKLYEVDADDEDGIDYIVFEKAE